MATDRQPAAITVDPEVQAAVDRVIKGIRDPEAMLRATERMDRMREEMQQRVGNVDLAVQLMREIRDGEQSFLDAKYPMVQPDAILR